MKWSQGYIQPFWDESFKNLNYKKESFNNKNDIERWRSEGYNQPIENFTGMMCPHGESHPDWTAKIVNIIQNEFSLNDIGVCFYRMETGTILPIHSDHYNVYKEKFKCNLEQIYRVLIFLENWKSGHYFEIDGNPIVNYKAGTFTVWQGDAKHMASNIGTEYRYTLQLTGWK
jgi:hypothetical protein